MNRPFLVTVEYHFLPILYKIVHSLYRYQVCRCWGPTAQLAVCLTADPGVASLGPAQPHNCMEIDHEIFSTVILSLPLIQKGQLSVREKVQYS